MGKKLNLAIGITLALVLGEVVAGYIANSLALLSDAGHNFADGLSLGLTWLAFWLQFKPASHKKTYGFQRVGILSAFINASSLVFIAGLIFYEGILRLLHPQPTNEKIMLVVAGISLVINTVIAVSLYQESKEDINIRGAFLHMFGDALSCVGILIAAVIIHLTGWVKVDAIVSLLIGLAILWSSWGIIKDSIHLLLDGTPHGIDVKHIIQDMRELDGVLNVHHVHIWSLSPEVTALSCHVEIENITMKEGDAVLRSIEHLLNEHHHIRHTTIQLEYQQCSWGDGGCQPNSMILMGDEGQAHQSHFHSH